MSLENKAAIVTGGDSGIGHAISLELGRQGAAVTINYHKNEDAADATVKAIRPPAAGPRRSRATCRRWPTSRTWSTRRSRRSAGSTSWSTTPAWRRGTSTLETTERQFDLVIAIDLKSAFFGVQLARSR